ncbi:c-type cytochrome [Aurantiacibacter odishensis]|uniref:c-type cytochrome n=1 Tax=Aurantiacibacter odishensis TaxID=1155476 RepID=UPI000E714BBA|nr:cytochrome c [Aurantiacibacter odishensis]
MKRLATIAGAAALLSGAGVALAQSAAGIDDETEEAAAAQAGPPPMPQPVTMAKRPDATGGEALYVEYCAMCHTANGMGTGLLARRVDTPILEERDNLAAAYVMVAARNGIGNMPAVPRGELSDEDLQAIADYLAAGPHEVTP